MVSGQVTNTAQLTTWPRQSVDWWLLVCVVVLVVTFLIRQAWICDDAYITFRTVDNFVNGYGLTWNTFERVQAYTHPLWMLLLSAVYLFTSEIYYTALILSMLLTTAAMVLLVLKIASNRFTGLLALMCLLVSKPFMDFSASGLENPLTHLLIVLYFIVYFRWKITSRTTLILTLLVSMICLNRLDMLLLVAPTWVYRVWVERSTKTAKAVAVGLIPVLSWELFSLIYYGFPFPNTAYAKLNTSIARSDLIDQGLEYLRNGLHWAPSTMAAIVAAVALAVAKHSARWIAPAIGIILYVGYVVMIGGGFMSGRFLTAPMLLAVIMLSRHKFHFRFDAPTVLAIQIVLLGVLWPCSPVFSDATYGQGAEKKRWHHGISDERAAYYQDTGLLIRCKQDTSYLHPWALQGQEAADAGERLVRRAGIGFFGFYAGPEVHVVDNHALAEPLLARLPVYNRKRWRIGHFFRDVPEGYLETLSDGSNRIVDPSLAEYYDRLCMVLRGPLWSWSRIREIVRFNLGANSELIEEYLTGTRTVAADKCRRPVKQGTRYDAKGCFILYEEGMIVLLDSTCHGSKIELSVDHNDLYELVFRQDTVEISSLVIQDRFILERGLRVDTVDTPVEAVDRGYDNIMILPKGGDGVYSLGHLRLMD